MSVGLKMTYGFTNLLELTGLLQKDGYVRKFVAHRAFHCPLDNLSRPLENTLTAYEVAWAAGISQCECDVAITKDHELILCHDVTLERLALRNDLLFKPVTQLTWNEVQNVALKNGSRVALLREVLQAACRINSRSKLVIELKPNADAELVSAKLCALFRENPEFLSQVSVIMSFDLDLIHCFNKLFKEIFKFEKRRPRILLLTLNLTKKRKMAKLLESMGPSTSVVTFRDTVAFTEISVDFEWSLPTMQETLERNLIRDDSKLDGLYMEYDETMLVQGSAASEFIRQNALEYCIGVWLRSKDPDNYLNFKALCSSGVRFVNSDIPDNFVN